MLAIVVRWCDACFIRNDASFQPLGDYGDEAYIGSPSEPFIYFFSSQITQAVLISSRHSFTKYFCTRLLYSVTEPVSLPKMKTSIAISLLALVAPICAVSMEGSDPRHFTFSDVSTTVSLPVGPPIPFPTGSGFPPFPTTLSTQTHHHRSHKTGGFHSYPTGGPFPTGTRPHRTHPHPTGGYHGEGGNGPRFDIHSSFLAALITHTTTGPKPPPIPKNAYDLSDGHFSCGKLERVEAKLVQLARQLC